MGLNLAEIQQKLDRLIQNMSEQNRRAYQIFYDPTPQDVELPQLDENGNLITVRIPNRAKIKAEVDGFIAGAETTIKGWWESTFHVDANNGDDSNDGSTSAPFRTIHKAVSSVPFGGKGTIKLLSSYTADSEEIVYVIGRQINIDFSNLIEVSWIRIEGTDTSAPALQFYVGHSGCISFYGNYGSDAKIVLHKNNTGYPESTSRNSFIRLLSDGNVNSASFYFLNTKENYPPIEVYSGGLVAGFPSSNMRSFKNIVFAEHYGKAGSDIIIDKDNGAFLFDFHLGCGALSFLTNCNIKDASGNNLSLADVTLGLVRDSNGNPRNVISNIIL